MLVLFPGLYVGMKHLHKFTLQQVVDRHTATHSRNGIYAKTGGHLNDINEHSEIRRDFVFAHEYA